MNDFKSLLTILIWFQIIFETWDLILILICKCVHFSNKKSRFQRACKKLCCVRYWYKFCNINLIKYVYENYLNSFDLKWSWGQISRSPLDWYWSFLFYCICPSSASFSTKYLSGNKMTVVIDNYLEVHFEATICLCLEV